MADFLDSPDCPAYAIRDMTHDRGGCRLLLLQRLNPEDASENCVLLPRPYSAGGAAIPQGEK